MKASNFIPTDELVELLNTLIYKGTIDCSSNPNYPTASIGWLYFISVSGKIGGNSGEDIEAGDLLICNADSQAGDQSTVGSNWDIIQKNIDGAVTGPTSSLNNSIVLFNGLSGKVIKDSGLTLSSFEPALTKGNLTEITTSSLVITGGTNAIIGSGVSIKLAQNIRADSSPTFAGLSLTGDFNFVRGAGRNISVNPQTGTNQGDGLTIKAGAGSGNPGYGGALNLFGGDSATGIIGARLLLGGGKLGQLDLVAGISGDLYIRGSDNSTLAGNQNGGDIYLQNGFPSGSGDFGKIRINSFSSQSSYADLDTHLLQADRLYSFPDNSGTIALLSDIMPVGNNTELQYNNNGIFGSSSDLTFANNILTIGTASGASTGTLRIYNTPASHYVQFTPSDTTALDISYTLPINIPSSGLNGFLKSSDNGLMSWDTNVYENILNKTSTLGASTSLYMTQKGVTQPFIDEQTIGFLNQTETTITFDGTNTFTLGDIGAGWSYYRAGIKYTISGNKTIIFSGSPVASNVYFIYINSTDGTLSQSTSVWSLTDNKLPVAVLLFNNALTPKFQLQDERHTVLMMLRDHYYLHNTRGSQIVSSGALTGYTLNSDVNGNKTFAIGASIMVDEDIIHDESALIQPNGTNTDYVVFYRTSLSTWNWKSSNMPFIYNVGNTNNWIQWDNAGTMTDATGGGGANTRWLNSYLLITNMEGSSRFILIPGRAIFTSLATAQSETPSSFDFTGLGIAEFVIMYQLTWTTVTSTSQGKCRLAATPKSINISIISNPGLGSSIDHNTLANLQGGTTGEYYHLTSAEYQQLLTLL